MPVLAFATLGLGQDGSATDPWRALQQVPRGIPDAGDHPGNVFLLGDLVTIASPRVMPPAVAWQVTDEQGREVGRGTLGEQPTAAVEIGRLEIGWYRISFRNETSQEVDWTTAAVLAPLQAPTPQDSPICIDSATAWFAKNDPRKQEQFSRLAALSGVNWVRDRLRWRDTATRSRTVCRRDDLRHVRRTAASFWSQGLAGVSRYAAVGGRLRRRDGPIPR